MVKKYFKKIIENGFSRDKGVSRKCPICTEILSLGDFKSSNFNKNVNLSEEGVWYDKRVAIPCCRCLKILEKLQGADSIHIFYNPRYDIQHLKIIHNSIFQENEIITVVKKEIIRNLYKYGIID